MNTTIFLLILLGLSVILVIWVIAFDCKTYSSCKMCSKKCGVASRIVSTIYRCPYYSSQIETQQCGREEP